MHPEQLTLEPHRMWVQKAPLATSSPLKTSGISFGVPEGFANCSKRIAILSTQPSPFLHPSQPKPRQFIHSLPHAQSHSHTHSEEAAVSTAGRGTAAPWRLRGTCFVLLSSNSPEKQPTPSPCQHPLTSRSPGPGLGPAHCAAQLLGLPHLDWPIMLQTPCPGPVGGRV
jgi:hypothetical protein|uniref:Uncharacterized protein n=1 Tax=Mus musculus TaxID=10090 RepID=Q9D9D6_MOUSE|nr:unnamed protein product [Mus musculus]